MTWTVYGELVNGVVQPDPDVVAAVRSEHRMLANWDRPWWFLSGSDVRPGARVQAEPGWPLPVLELDPDEPFACAIPLGRRPGDPYRIAVHPVYAARIIGAAMPDPQPAPIPDMLTWQGIKVLWDKDSPAWAKS